MIYSEEFEKRGKEQFSNFIRRCNLKHIKNKSILEIGFGNGFFLRECQNKGMDSYGVEILQGYINHAKKLNPNIKALISNSKKLPFESELFDFVVSFQVLEHVQSTKDFIDESIRVLKPGGIAYHVVPNYHSFYEGHLNLLWLPFLNKRTGKFYVRMFGKNVSYFETLNLVKYFELKKMLKEYESEIDLLTLGENEFGEFFNSANILKIQNIFLSHLVSFFMQIKIHKIIIWLIPKMGLQYPIIMLFKKK